MRANNDPAGWKKKYFRVGVTYQERYMTRNLACHLMLVLGIRCVCVFVCVFGPVFTSPSSGP